MSFSLRKTHSAKHHLILIFDNLSDLAMTHILSSIEGSALDSIPNQRALLSVSDKTGLLELAQALAGFGIHLLSTGGTAKTLRDAGLAVTDVSEYTGFPEILDGRVKTLHPKVHGALLAVRGNAKHEQELVENGIGPIDLVVMNLYPFQATGTLIPPAPAPAVSCLPDRLCVPCVSGIRCIVLPMHGEHRHWRPMHAAQRS